MYVCGSVKRTSLVFSPPVIPSIVSAEVSSRSSSLSPMPCLLLPLAKHRMKRGLLYACCRENGYNKLVLAQHLDDLAESFIMSALHNGQARAILHDNDFVL